MPHASSTSPLRLYAKAKSPGVWNPRDFDLTQDILDWQWLNDNERDLVLRLTSLFQAGAETITHELSPLITVIAAEGRREEETYLTTCLADETKHADFFRRLLNEVVRGGIDPSTGKPLDLTRYHTANYRALFYEALPRALRRLRTDASPAAQAQAAVTYHLIGAGVLAETGYHAYLAALEKNGLLPGACKAIHGLQQDEARHVAYGVYLLARLVAADDRLWQAVEAKANELLPLALGIIGDACASYAAPPFGLRRVNFAGDANARFQKRLARLARARGQTLDAIVRATRAVIEQDDV